MTHVTSISKVITVGSRQLNVPLLFKDSKVLRDDIGMT